MFDLILFIVGIILCLVGIVGSFIPIVPGPVSSWFGLLILNFTKAVEFNYQFIALTFIIAIIISVLDYLVPIIGVKKLGGSRGGLIGASIGLVTALIILGPLGLLIGPFIGAITGEMINKKNFTESLKPALGSLIGILIGSGIKFCLSLIYLFFYLNIFWTYKENFF
ncbi:MAG: hypothetical protein CMD13_04355 [Flavobacteriales bacterium]|nr:hypothetical protein [Flavobacteriales bacterium]